MLGIFGSPTLIGNLIRLGLVDELRVMIHPVALGRGKSLFASLGSRVSLQLLRTTVFRSGNVLLTYRPR